MADDGDLTPNVEIEGAAEAEAALKNLGDTGEQAFNKIAAAAEKVGGASDGMKKLGEEGAAAFEHIASTGAEAFSKILESVAGGNFAGVVTKMFGEIAGAVTEATEKLIEFVSEQAKEIETLSNLGAATGMTIAQVLGLKEAFESVGVSTNGYERAMARLAIMIANDWPQIQQVVRTSAEQQIASMVSVQQAALGVQKSMHAVGDAFADGARTAAHDALAIETATLSLRKANQEMSDFALQSKQNTLSIESAQLALAKARMNLAKDQGQTVSAADEKALKLETDKLAVKQAELALTEAQSKKNKEALEMEQLQLNVKKLKQEAADAEAKQLADSIKSYEQIKQVELDRVKAANSLREAQEKAHETDLKNLPAIAAQIQEVISGQRQWMDVTNRTEIATQSLTKAIILASSSSGTKPAVLDVFREMAQLFQKMGNDAEASSTKIAIVQHMMGAGFRAGQASAAELMAVLNRGWESAHHLLDEMQHFDHALNITGAAATLKEFNSSVTLLGGTLDLLKTKLAAIIAPPLTAFFNALREAITGTGTAVNKIGIDALVGGIVQLTVAVAKLIGLAIGPWFNVFGEVLSRVMTIIGDTAKALAIMISWITQLLGMKSSDAVLKGMEVGALAAAAAFTVLGRAVAFFMARFAIITISVGLVITAIGNLVAAVKMLPKWLGGEGASPMEAHKNEIEQLGKSILNAATGGATGSPTGNATFDAMTKALGLQLDKSADKLDHGASDLKGAVDPLKAAGDKHATAADKLMTVGDKFATLGDASTQLSTSSASLQSASDSLKQSAAALLAAAQAKPTGRAATGGHIRGPGGPTDDKAGLYALSDGEYVVRTAAVNHYGAPLFDALNSLSVGGFATGGMVSGARAPSTPAGPNLGPSSILNLSIDGNQFNGLRAPENVANKLKSYAVTRLSSSAGRRPSWMR